MVCRKYFFDFMKDNYIKEDSPAGDLTREMDRDRTFPRESTKRKEIMDHLKHNNACPECLQIFKWCWEEYIYWKGEAVN